MITVPTSNLHKNYNLVCEALETARLEEYINRPKENDVPAARDMQYCSRTWSTQDGVHLRALMGAPNERVYGVCHSATLCMFMWPFCLV